MKRTSTKTAAEAVLRELPSVLGAYVSEDLEGHPREIHILIRHGPDPASLARDIRNLLEERLGIPIDQRIISIAQLAPESGEGAEPEPNVAAAETTASGKVDGGRPIFAGLESTVSSGHVTVGVRLEWQDELSDGSAEAVDTTPGRARAAATATLRAALGAAWRGDLKLELDFASIVQALDGDYILVNSAKGRQKHRNMEKRRQVAIEIPDPENPNRFLSVRGTVVQVTETGADQHLDELAARYLNRDRYPESLRFPGEVRRIYKIRPERVTVWDPFGR